MKKKIYNLVEKIGTGKWMGEAFLGTLLFLYGLRVLAVVIEVLFF